MDEASHQAHVEAVAADYEARVPEWRSVYDGRTFHDHAIRQRLTRALELVDLASGGGDALDVGCGAGQMLEALGQRGLRVSGCDLAEGMVAASRERLATAGFSADVRVADVTALPWDDGRFTWVTALGVLEYLTSPAAGLAELARVAAPGSHVLVTMPNPVRLAYLLDPLGAARKKLSSPKGGYPRRYMAPWQLRRAIGRAGLDVVALEGHGLGPFTLLNRPLLREERAIALGARLERVLPRRVVTLLGANLVALARKP